MNSVLFPTKATYMRAFNTCGTRHTSASDSSSPTENLPALLVTSASNAANIHHDACQMNELQASKQASSERRTSQALGDEVLGPEVTLTIAKLLRQQLEHTEP